MDEKARAEFGHFVAERTTALIRLGYLLTGNQHAAEDLLQTALVKTAIRWKHLRNADPEGYVRTVMYREQVSWWRRSARRRQQPGPFPELTSTDQCRNVDQWLTLRSYLLQLPPDQRAVLVLRFYEDLSETQAAQILGCPIGTVRSRTHRAMCRLRELLSDDQWSPEVTR